jgi:hypothetical protein
MTGRVLEEAHQDPDSFVPMTAPRETRGCIDLEVFLSVGGSRKVIEAGRTFQIAHLFLEGGVF